ncbi:MAG: peptide deformylase [Campylobacterota bacterium]
MIRDIVIYPDSRLRKVSAEVTEFNKELHTLLDDMYETMIVKYGIGLAAVQVGVLQRILVVNLPREDEIQYKEDLLEIINPKIVDASQELETFTEGCLSVPEIFEDVERAKKITLEYQDRHGKKQTLDAEGILSIALQHEIDHLDGKVFIDTLSFTKRKKFEKEWKKSLKQNKTATK